MKRPTVHLIVCYTTNLSTHSHRLLLTGPETEDAKTSKAVANWTERFEEDALGVARWIDASTDDARAQAVMTRVIIKMARGEMHRIDDRTIDVGKIEFPV